MYIYIYAHTYMYECTYVFSCIYLFIHVYSICMYIYVYTYVHICRICINQIYSWGLNFTQTVSRTFLNTYTVSISVSCRSIRSILNPIFNIVNVYTCVRVIAPAQQCVSDPSLSQFVYPCVWLTTSWCVHMRVTDYQLVYRCVWLTTRLCVHMCAQDNQLSVWLTTSCVCDWLPVGVPMCVTDNQLVCTHMCDWLPSGVYTCVWQNTSWVCD